MKHVIEVSPKPDIVLKVSHPWEARDHAQIICPNCRRILPEHMDRGIDIELDEKDTQTACLLPERRSVAMTGLWGVRAVIVRKDLATAAGLDSEEFSFGSVSLSGRELPDYQSAAAKASTVVHVNNDRIMQEGTCESCGQIWQAFDFNSPFWFSAEAVEGREVFMSQFRKDLFVTPQRWTRIEAGFGRQLYTREVEIR